MQEIVRGINVTKIFKKGILSINKRIAVERINISLFQGETLTILGESGSGKTTLVKLLLKIIKPTYGEVLFLDKGLIGNISLLSQHPEKAFDPRWEIQQSLLEPAKIKKIKLKEELLFGLLEKVNLNIDLLKRYPHEVSGGELQRIALLRAVISNPRLLACDEPTSMLDPSTQALIINFLLNLKRERFLTLIFITHDIELAKVISERTAIMYYGEIVELGQNIFKEPLHPYTKLFLKGEIKHQENPSVYSTGCKFYQTCPLREKICLHKKPPLAVLTNREVKCWLYT